MNYMEAVLAPVEEVYRAQVYAATWGHLAPERDHEYPGSVLFAHSVYGGDGSTIINDHFEDLPSSPWFYDGLGELLRAHRDAHEHGEVEGGVYLWSGVYELRITPPEYDDEGWELEPGKHEHVWTGMFRTIVDPTGEMP